MSVLLAGGHGGHTETDTVSIEISVLDYHFLGYGGITPHVLYFSATWRWAVCYQCELYLELENFEAFDISVGENAACCWGGGGRGRVFRSIVLSPSSG